MEIIAEKWTKEEELSATKWAQDNPHLSFYLRKALAHIRFLEDSKQVMPSIEKKVAAAREVC